MALTVPTGVNMQNIAYVCATNMTTNPTGPNGEVICGNPTPVPPPPTGQCTPTNNPQKDPACIVVNIPGFDLFLKKYIGINDAQTVATAVSTTNGANLEYRITVTNAPTSTMATSGTTTVKDILPV